MKIFLVTLIMIFNIFSNALAKYDQLAYEFSFENIEGGFINLKDFENQVIIVVNVASRCGFTNQYEDMQNLWNNYKDKKVVILGIPSNNFRQEPATNKEIKEFCDSNFGINFPMSKKTDVVGTNAHPFFKWAKKNHGNSAVPKWNFHKIIVGKNGKIIDTFSSITKPSSLKFTNLIEKEIKN